MKKKFISVLMCTVFIASLSLMPKQAEANERFLSSMDIDIIREDQHVSGDGKIAGEAGPGSGGGEVGGSYESKQKGAVIGVVFECKFALHTCNPFLQRYIAIPAK